MFLRQSTSQIIRFGPFLDSTDGVTPETALTIAQADMQLSKDGATFAQKNASGNATHDTDGWYSTTLNTTDTATTGELKIQINVSGALPVWEKWFVLTASAYDALQTGTFNNLGGTAQTGDNFVRIGVNGAGLTNINLPNQTMDIAGNITGNLSGSVGSVTAAVTVGTINANVINAASIAAAAMNGKGDWNIGKTGYSLTITPPTAVENRQEMDTNSVDLNMLISGQSAINSNVLLIDTAAMRGTDSAALASVCTELRLAELDAANLPTDIAAIDTAPMRGTDGANTTTPPTTAQIWSETTRTLTAFTFTVNCDVQLINGATVLGNGTSGNLWRG